MKLLIDASVFIAFFNDTDIFYEESLLFFKSLSQNKDIIIVLPILVFLEISNVLQKKKKIESFDEGKLWQAFDKYERVDLGFDSSKEYLLLFKQINLKTSDAIIAVCAKLTDATLVTWDKKILKEAKKLANVQTPKMFLNKISYV